MGHRCDLLEFMEETLGQRLARLRKGKQLTQGQLAEIAGIGQSAIGNIESGPGLLPFVEPRSIGDEGSFRGVISITA